MTPEQEARALVTDARARAEDMVLNSAEKMLERHRRVFHAERWPFERNCADRCEVCVWLERQIEGSA